MTAEDFVKAYRSVTENIHVSTISALPLLSLLVLISITKIIKIGHTTFSFEMVHDIYKQFCKKSLNRGHGTPYYFIKPIVLKSWEQLEYIGLLCGSGPVKEFKMMRCMVGIELVRDAIKEANVADDIKRWYILFYVGH